MLAETLRLHASYGTGIRPARGSDLAFDHTPLLKPERTESLLIASKSASCRKISACAYMSATGTCDSHRLAGQFAFDAFGFQTTTSLMLSQKARTFSARLSASSPWFSVSANYTWLRNRGALPSEWPATDLWNNIFIRASRSCADRSSPVPACAFHYGKLECQCYRLCARPRS